MKATINGISVEGTPEEILKYQKLQDERNEQHLKIKLSYISKNHPYYDDVMQWLEP